MEESLLITRTNYRVSDFLSWQRQGGLDLRPPFQRGSVWSKKAKSFFVDSVVRGYPVPLLFLQDRTDPETYEPQRLVVDGQQRLRTILAYIDRKCLNDADDADDFSVLALHNKDIAGKPFKGLDEEVQQRILQFQFSVNVLAPTTPDQQLLEIFARMNSTGIRVNDQELRNASNNGAFKQLAYGLSYEEINRWLRFGVFNRGQIARMKDVEMTSELVMYLFAGLNGKSQKRIDKAYATYDDDVPNAKATSKRFSRVFDRIEEVYPIGQSFSKTPFKGQGWFYCLFAFLDGLAYSRGVLDSPQARPTAVDVSRVRAHLDMKEAELKADNLDDKLMKALRGAATDTSSRKSRLEFLLNGWNGA